MVLVMTAGAVMAGIYNGQWILERYQREATTVEADQMRILRAADMARHLMSHLKEADRTIDIAVYTVTGPYHRTTQNLLDILEERTKNGVRVRVVLDGDRGGAVSFGREARKRGIAVTLDTRPSGSMHHKFAVIDGEEVYTGSANWTVTAFYREEETTIYAENQELANQFTNEFNQLWNNQTE